MIISLLLKKIQNFTQMIFSSASYFFLCSSIKASSTIDITENRLGTPSRSLWRPCNEPITWINANCRRNVGNFILIWVCWYWSILLLFQSVCFVSFQKPSWSFNFLNDNLGLECPNGKTLIMMTQWDMHVSALLALCEGNPPINDGLFLLSDKGPVTQSFELLNKRSTVRLFQTPLISCDISVMVSWVRLLSNPIIVTLSPEISRDFARSRLRCRWMTSATSHCLIFCHLAH